MQRLTSFLYPYKPHMNLLNPYYWCRLSRLHLRSCGSVYNIEYGYIRGKYLNKKGNVKKRNN